MPRPAPGGETKNFQTTHVSSVPLRGQFYFDTGGTLTVIYVGHSSALMKVKSRWESLLSLGFLPRAQSGANYTCARSIFFPTVEGNLKSQMKICVGFYSPDISRIKNQHTRIRWAWSSVIYKKIPWKKLWGNIKTDRGQRWAGRPHWISFSVPPCLLFWRQNTRGGFPCTQHLRTAASPCLSLLQYFYLTFQHWNISNKLD